MESDLLKKEKEYYELNKKLEKRTRELLSEVDNVMKFQENIIESVPKFDPKKYAIEEVTKYSRKSKSANLDAKECKDLDIPEDAANMGAKGLVQFLKAKVKKLQYDCDKQRQEYKSKCEEVKKLQNENLKLSVDSEKWLQNRNSSKTNIMKLENQLSHLQSKLQTKESENSALKKETDHLQKEIKTVKYNSANVEVRMNRAIEEHDKTKAILKHMKEEEKEMRESQRKQLNELTAVVRKIEKHKGELLNGFKKQLILIDNLKKQKAHMESFKLTEKVEADFMKMLEWNE